MILDQLLSSLILIAAFFIFFWIGKVVHNLIHREYNLTEQLVEKDNPAVALAITGYYLGLVLCLGGAVTGPSQGIIDDLLDLSIYGSLGIILLNLSWIWCDKMILYRFRVTDELIRDKNQGTGAVSCGVSIASGAIIFGAISGQGGNVWTAVAFWAIGQLLLVLAAKMYNLITPFDIHGEIEKDNVAAGVSFAGALTAMGLVVGLAAEGDFDSWADDLLTYLIISLFGLIMLPIVRFLTDKILLPTVKLTDEIAAQETPNVGAAYIEAFAYIAAAFIISWCV
ncbi:MAG: DUF350 domain-containing protein [Deltaproteobacteria bacterium]|nr:DUF350 domain-containing protein [Deltaproteobacteria bacterium]